MKIDLLIEIALDTGTERLSLHGSKTSAGVYVSDLAEVGDIVREIEPGGGISSIESGSFVIRDASGAWREKVASTTWKKRVVTVKVVDQITGSIETVSVGKIETVSLGREEVEVEFRDDSFDRLEEPASPLKVFPDLFADVPITTEVNLIPIVLGSIDSTSFDSRGHVPAYLVDPAETLSVYRYVAAQHPLPSGSITAVYRRGEVVPVSEYSVNYADISTSLYGTVRMTFIDFDHDQRDEDGEDVLITYDCSGGLTDTNLEGGSAITNPAEALKAFLELRGLVSSSEFDSTLQSAAETALTSAGITVGLAVVEEGVSWLDVVEMMAISYNLQLFRTRTGDFGIRFDNAAGDNSSSLTHFRDDRDIRQESASFESVEESASTLEFFYAYDFGRGQFVGRNTFNDSTEQTSLGRDVRDEVELTGIRNVNQGKKISEIKLFQRRSSRYVGEIMVPVQASLEVGDHVKVTHFQGSESDGLGFREKVFQVVGMSLVFDDGLQHELALIDAPGLSLSSPADAEPGRTSQNVPPASAEMFSDIVFSVDDSDTVSWTSHSLKMVWGRRSQTFAGIGSGSTGNMGATTYIYFDPDVSTAALQTTTTFSDAVGGRRRLLAIASPSPTSRPASIRIKVGFVTVEGVDVPSTTGGDEVPNDAFEDRHLSSINASTVNAGTFTAFTFETASGNPKIIFDPTSLRGIDAAGVKRLELDNDSLTFWNASGVLSAALTADSFGQLEIDGDVKLAAGHQIEVSTGGINAGGGTLELNDNTLVQGDLEVTGSITASLGGGGGTINLADDVDIAGTLTVDTIDNSGAGKVTVQDPLTVTGAITTGGGLIPNSDGTQNIGSAAFVYNGVYCEFLDSDGTGITIYENTTVSGSLDVTGTLTVDTIDDRGGGVLDIDATDVHFINDVQMGGDLTVNTIIGHTNGYVTMDELVVGVPTGGNKGTGTINAVAVYDDNTLLTDYVFEEGYELISIEEMRKFFQEKKHLPWIDGRKVWEESGKPPVGRLVSQIWEAVECQAIYISELESRLRGLEAA